jgi:hypothetical protein
MTDELDPATDVQVEIDGAYLRGKIRLQVKRSNPDLLEDPDFPRRLDQKVQSRILVSKDRKSYAVLDTNGTPMPGAGGIALQRLADELVREFEAELGPSMETIMAAKRSEYLI